MPRKLWRAGLFVRVENSLIAEVCLIRGQHPELLRLCPRNSTSETANSHLGRPMVRPCRQQSLLYSLGSTAFCCTCRILQQNVHRIKQDFIFIWCSQKKKFNHWWLCKPYTTIPVVYSTNCEDWTVVEDSSQWGFKPYNSPFCIRAALLGFP